MAVAILSFRRELQVRQLQVPEAIAFPRCSPRHENDEQQRPQQVLLFSGLAQLVLGVSVLITLKMQLEHVLPTATVACAWLMFTGITGLCASCYVTSSVDHRSLEYHNRPYRKSFIICLRVYIGLLLIGVALTIAMSVHGVFKDISDPPQDTGIMISWEPGMSCLAFGLLLSFLDCMIISAVRKALRQYYTPRNCRTSGTTTTTTTAAPAHRPAAAVATARAARVTLRHEPLHITVGSLLPPPYPGVGHAVEVTNHRVRAELQSAQVPLLTSSAAGRAHERRNQLSPTYSLPPSYSIQMPPSYSEAMGFHTASS
ncbi:uncharacterized protein LOC129580664 [Paramacrobiotus metropolitanus]|uniref:uncharacterized protein LOC129580664 n=1 Tax=Paramacrobiotus metropolitanus TaxID=2943436 RepID=UPI0024457E10|nr:uncharacterized protein LOC129580664 [Paramacrobiotus metropolitanus]